MKKFLSAVCIIALTVIAAVVFTGCDPIKPQHIFSSNTEVTLPKYEFVTKIDTRGDFLGDGELVYIFQFNEENGKTLETRVQAAEHWQPLPMTETLNYLVYEHFDGEIPRVQTGYYFFYDQQNESYTVPEDFIEQSYSYDFVIGMYDSQSRTAYYYEQHT